MLQKIEQDKFRGKYVSLGDIHYTSLLLGTGVGLFISAILMIVSGG